MSRTGKFLGFVGAGLLIVAICLLTFSGFQAFYQAGATARLGVITAAISVTTLVYNNSRQQAREIRARQFTDKREAYKEFFSFFFEMFSSQPRGDIEIDEDTISRMRKLTQGLMVWGSAETINSYNSYMRASLTIDPNDTYKLFSNTENLLRAFRKDLGHSDKSLESFGLTKLILKADEHHRLE